MQESALVINPQAVKIEAFRLHADLLGEEVYFEDARGRKTIGRLTSVKAFLAEGVEGGRGKTTIHVVVGGNSLWLKHDEVLTFLRMSGDPQEGAL